VLTVSLKLLYALVIVHHGLRRLVTVGVTLNPTADWVAGQVTGKRVTKSIFFGEPPIAKNVVGGADR
jgi:hypothetical protein